MPRKKTPKEYAQECKEKGYDPPVEDYINARTKIKHKCQKGHIYEQTPHSHLQGQGCSKCSGNYSYTPEEYAQECKEKGYDPPIEDYVDANTKIKFKCSGGHIYTQRPDHHLNGHGCKLCATNILANKRRKETEEYLQECKDKGYDPPIEDYKGDRVKVNHKCQKGHIYPQTPHNHLQGQGCSECNGSFKKKPEEYVQECKDRGYDSPIENYINNKTKINHKCSRGHIYPQTPKDHLKGKGCFICKESHGERFIRNYLDKHNIKYEPQKTFNDLKDESYLSYDFYLPNYNILIEYQGEQHYNQVEHFGGVSKFNKQQLHDNLKRKYAKDNGYKLLELHYSLDTQDKVDKYLERRINKFKVRG